MTYSEEELREDLENLRDSIGAGRRACTCDRCAALARITDHIADLTKARARLTELEQRLARVAELAHDRDGDTLEARSRRLGQCAEVSWDHMEESFSDDPLKKCSTLKWAHLAEQLSSAEQKIEELTRELEEHRAKNQKRLRQEAIDSLRMAPSEPGALDVNGRTYNEVGSGRCSHGAILFVPCAKCESIVTERMAQIAAQRNSP